MSRANVPVDKSIISPSSLVFLSDWANLGFTLSITPGMSRVDVPGVKALSVLVHFFSSSDGANLGFTLSITPLRFFNRPGVAGAVL